MRNNVLGLKIDRYYNGVANVVNINDQPSWVEHTIDIRNILKAIDNIEGATEPILILKNIECGYLVAIVKPIGGRVTDCTIAWIYIPNCIKISGKQIAEIIEQTKAEILESRINEERLNILFEQEYEELSTRKMIYASTGDRVAFRYYGKGCVYNLSEILEELNQPYYKDYNYIFILDKESGLVCFGDDLTGRSMVSTVLIQPPTPIDEFHPYIGDKPFESSVLVAEGSEIRIVWRRRGFEDITKICKVEKMGLSEKSKPSRNEYKCIVPYDRITVTDEKGRKIYEYTLWIDDTLVAQGGSVKIIYEKLANVRVRIDAENYEVVDDKFDLRSYQTIRLDRRRFIYDLQLSLSNDKIIPIQIVRNTPLRKSPIRGYRIDGPYDINGGKVWLDYQPFNRKKLLVYIILWTLVSLVVGGFIGYKYIYKGTKPNIKQLEMKIQSLERENESLRTQFVGSSSSAEIRNENALDNWSKIIDYLNQEKWIKSEMDNFSEIKGLWEDINTYSFQNILSRGDINRLKESETFGKLIEAIERNKGKENFLYGKKKFCRKASDTQITIKNYIDDLDKQEQPSIETSPTESHKGNNTQTDWL